MIFLFRKLFFLVVILSLSNNLYAVNINYTVEGGVGYSDNITRVETNIINDSVRFIGGTLSVVDESSSNDFVLDMDLSYHDYREDTFEDDVIANIALASEFSIVDEALTWTLDGSYGQQAINAFTVTTPDNLQDTGLLSTGPNLILRFTSLDSLTLQYRYIDFFAETTAADYQSNNFDAILSRRLSSLHTLSLVASYQDLRYEDDFNADFEDFRYSVLFAGASTTTQYSLEWGIIDVEFENGEDFENDLKRFSLSRQMNRYNSFSVQLSETIENGSRASNSGIPGAVTTGLFVNDMAVFSYAYTRNDFSVAFSSSYSDQDYVVQNTQDQKVLSNSLGFVYGSPFRLRTSLNFQHIARDFYGIAQTNEEDTITLSFERNLSQNLGLIGAFSNFSRESSTQLQTIDENRVLVTLQYAGRI